MAAQYTLPEEWRRKLKASGFHDIEDRYGGIPRYHRVRETDTAEYFAAATGIVDDPRFRTAFQRDVWKRHVSGASARKIARDFGTSRRQIVNVITLGRRILNGDVGTNGRVLSSEDRRLTAGGGHSAASAVSVLVLLSDAEADALYHLAKKWNKNRQAVIRQCLIERARSE